MGGEMGVESEPEKGSTFWFTARLRKQSSDVDESSRPSLTSVTGRVEDEVDPSEHRILVAEDNANNQMLVLRQLEKLGYRADVAVNGLEVLEALARTRYTLVFMDCQMPEMNGFRAAAEYRKREDAKLHLPIIAMSAGSIEDNREKWLGAGMDDYLLKPVSLEKLAAIISHWLPAADASLDSLDTSLLEEMVDSFGGDVEFLAEMIQAYQDSIPESLDVLRKALQGQDANTVRIVAHGLKSSSGQFGARRMAFLFMNLEKLGKIAQLAEAGDLIRALESEFARVRVELQEAAVRLSAAAKA
jgi:CheY-like chemotaxis protein